jgi:hypothetical protein
VEPQNLVGNPQRPDVEHTVFVFDRATVKRIVPLFGDLVLRTVPREILAKHTVCVVGNRVNAAHHAKDNFPTFLGDYLDAYVSPRAAKPTAPDSYLGYVVEARKKWMETGTGAEPYNLAVSGILALLRRAIPGELEPFPRTKTSLHQALTQNGRLPAFQKILWSLINPVALLNEHLWAKCIIELTTVIGVPNPMNEIAEFLRWEECHSATAATGPKLACKVENIYHHHAGDTLLPIRFDSIHAVKGETHAATLVVETFAKQHDLEALLTVLTAQTHGSQLKNTLRGHCKRIFVAMSRPSNLLCLAISSEHIDEAQINALEANGWKVLKIKA